VVLAVVILRVALAVAKALQELVVAEQALVLKLLVMR
jgi:hypothetical protein